MSGIRPRDRKGGSQPAASSAAARQVFELTGGAPCLDFVNTVGDRPTRAVERLRDYTDLLAFGRQAAILDPTTALALARRAASTPRSAAAALRRAVSLREALYRTFTVLAAGERPSEEDVEVLNRALRQALPHLALDLRGRQPSWDWREAGDHMDSVLWPIARSAAELLTSGDVERVRECAAGDCGWLFLDRSRNRRRRWCDMTTCGNRQKARRHYRRRRATS